MTRIVQMTPDLGITLRMHPLPPGQPKAVPNLGWWDSEKRTWTRLEESMVMALDEDRGCVLTPPSVAAMLTDAGDIVSWTVTWNDEPWEPGPTAPDVSVTGRAVVVYRDGDLAVMGEGVLTLTATAKGVIYGPITLAITGECFQTPSPGWWDPETETWTRLEESMVMALDEDCGCVLTPSAVIARLTNSGDIVSWAVTWNDEPWEQGPTAPGVTTAGSSAVVYRGCDLAAMGEGDLTLAATVNGVTYGPITLAITGGCAPCGWCGAPYAYTSWDAEERAWVRGFYGGGHYAFIAPAPLDGVEWWKDPRPDSLTFEFKTGPLGDPLSGGGDYTSLEIHSENQVLATVYLHDYENEVWHTITVHLDWNEDPTGNLAGIWVASFLYDEYELKLRICSSDTGEMCTGGY